MRSLVAVLPFVLGAGALAPVEGQGPPASTAMHGAFAFPDRNGARLITTAPVAQPALLTAALCSGGRRLVVQFDRAQDESRATTRRQTPENFENTRGAVFRIVGGTIDPASTCFLATAQLMSGGPPVSVKPADPPASCGQGRKAQYEAARGRPVVACWLLATSNTGEPIGLIEFARRLRSALASLVVVDGERAIFADYPAEFTAPGVDLWRVDDGGVMSPEGYEVVFVLRRGTSSVLGVSWSGTEGINLALWTADDGDRFTETINDYWYRAPR